MPTKLQAWKPQNQITRIKNKRYIQQVKKKNQNAKSTKQERKDKSTNERKQKKLKGRKQMTIPKLKVKHNFIKDAIIKFHEEKINTESERQKIIMKHIQTTIDNEWHQFKKEA